MHNAQCVKHNGEIPRFAWNLFLLTAIYYKKYSAVTMFYFVLPPTIISKW